MEDGVCFHSNFQTEYEFGYQLVVKRVLLLLDVFHLKSHLSPRKIENKIKTIKCFYLKHVI